MRRYNSTARCVGAAAERGREGARTNASAIAKRSICLLWPSRRLRRDSITGRAAQLIPNIKSSRITVLCVINTSVFYSHDTLRSLLLRVRTIYIGARATKALCARPSHCHPHPRKSPLTSAPNIRSARIEHCCETDEATDVTSQRRRRKSRKARESKLTFVVETSGLFREFLGIAGENRYGHRGLQAPVSNPANYTHYPCYPLLVSCRTMTSTCGRVPTGHSRKKSLLL